MHCHRHWLTAAVVAAISAAASPAPADAPLGGGWKLMHSQGRDGRDNLAMSHIADMTRSDLDLAGLLLRCHAKADPPEPMMGGATAQLLIVVITPFPPHTVPAVTIGAGSKEWHFDARVVPPGVELLLPAEATELASGPWQAMHELAVKVSSKGRSFGGVVPIDGLQAALAALAAECPAD
jgi:hypothetical protein